VSKTKESLAYDLWVANNQPSQNYFTVLVYRLIAKADLANVDRLRLAFPDEVEMWHAWFNALDEKAFFAQYGVIA
jgi:hypothetical protein